MGRKRNWDKISSQRPTDTAKYRDVYEDQQLDRGTLQEKQTMTGRTIVAIMVGILVFFFTYFLMSLLNGIYPPSKDIKNLFSSNNTVTTTEQSGQTAGDAGTNATTEAATVISFTYDEKTYTRGSDGIYYNSKYDYLTIIPSGATDIRYDGVDYSTTETVTETETTSEESADTYDYETNGFYYKGHHYHYVGMNSYENDDDTFDVLGYIPDTATTSLESESNDNTGNAQSTLISGFTYKENHYSYDSETDRYVNDNYLDVYKNDVESDDWSLENTFKTAFSKGFAYEGHHYTRMNTKNGVLFINDDDENSIYESIPRYAVTDEISGFEYDGNHYTYDWNTQKYINDTDSNRVLIDIPKDAIVDVNVQNVFDSIPDEAVMDADVSQSTGNNANVRSTKSWLDWSPNLLKIMISFIVGLSVFALLYSVLKRNLTAVNLMADTSDINQYKNDQHIQLPEEIMNNYDWFPDVGAHSNVQVSSMISHVALKRKGLKTVNLARRYDKDVLDEDGDPEFFKGDIIEDENGNPVCDKVPIIDEDFMIELFNASGAPDDKNVRKFYDATKIPYNPGGKSRVKQAGSQDTVAQMINEDWEFPIYEPQRPAGAYIVDTEPVNTMVLAITRAGKGQTVIEPTIDMWTREKRPNNMVINDPKGELLVKNYVRGTVRGFQIVQFNLINAMKTDIYNPLALAADAAREGDSTKCAMYIENIAEVFFPLDGGDDPVWPNAANNAFKRAAYGLIDFYLEEEKELRLLAGRIGMDEKVMESKIDQLWGKVTLYNCYQLFVQLSSKKKKSPAAEFTADAKAGKYDSLSDEEYQELMHEAEKKSKIWEDKPEADMLTLFFNATEKLPKNSMRTLVGNANSALRSMAGAEKMMASVYGIAITAMSFFTDPTISTLTSGTLSQNVDLAGMSFPRRLGVRFHSDYLAKYNLIGMQAKWDAFEDDKFTKPLGKDFYHEDLINREGWAKYYFKGIFPNDVSYVRLQVVDPKTGLLIKVFYFRFVKDYQTSLDGRYYVTDPILENKIVKNGVLMELKQKKSKKTGETVYKKGSTTFKKLMIDLNNGYETRLMPTNAIISTMTRYSEKPKMVFLVTPPHLMKYAKLILILIKQLVDLNFDQSYMTKSNQKPLYKTRFMLDELGNLQSEGHGISGFETMLSIGLGQEQQFTLILQTLQQLKDVYGVMILSTNRVAAYS